MVNGKLCNQISKKRQDFGLYCQRKTQYCLSGRADNIFFGSEHIAARGIGLIVAAIKADVIGNLDDEAVRKGERAAGVKAGGVVEGGGDDTGS